MNSSGFVPNDGQLADDVVYEVGLVGGILQVQPLGWQLRVTPSLTTSVEPITLTMQLVGASAPAAWDSHLPLVTTVSDYRHADQSRWRTDLPQYQQIQASTVYPHIDLQYTVTPSTTLKSSYLVAAGADPSQIGWRYPEAAGVHIATDGSLVIQINATTTITERAPIAWQDIGEDRLFVPVAFRIAQDGTVGFAVGAYDPSHPLVLDPSLTINRVFGPDLRAVSNLAHHPNGQYYLAGSGDSGAVLWRIGSDGQTPLDRQLLGSLATHARVAVTSGGMIVVGVGSYVAENPQLVQIVRFATPTSIPVVETIANGMIDDLVAHPSAEQVWMAWHNLPSNIGTVTTITPSVSNHTTTTAPPMLYRHLAVNSSGVLYGSFSRWTVTSSGLSEDWSAGVSRWVGTGWVIVYERFPSGNHTTADARVASESDNAWISGPLAIDSAGNLWVAFHESVTNASYDTVIRLWVASITPTGALPILRRLSDEVSINDFYSATFANALTVFSTGQVLVGGVTNGLTSATRTFGVQRGFLITLHPNGTVLEQHELQGSSNYEQWIIDLIEAAGDGIVVGMRSTGSDTAGFLGHATVGAINAVQPPRFTKSYYVLSTDAGGMHELGCFIRDYFQWSNAQGVVVLALGSPRNLGSDINPIYGIKPIRITKTNKIIGISDVKNNTVAFIEGYLRPSIAYDGHVCSRNEHTELPPKGRLKLALGVSNSAVYGESGWKDNPDLTFAHGVAWSKMLSDINNNYLEVPLMLDGSSIKPREYVSIAGAYDAEYITPVADNLDTGGAKEWTSYEPETRQWIDGFTGYQRQQSKATRIPYYFFGSCESCPRSDTGNLEHMRRLYHVAFKQPFARAIPQIYQGPYAYEWFHVRRYLNKNSEFTPVDFTGVMTQCGASGCSGDDPVPYEPRLPTPLDCASTGFCLSDSTWAEYGCIDESRCPNFTPNHGWQALFDFLRLNKTKEVGTDSQVIPQVELNYITDIACEPEKICFPTTTGE
ncbi:hypothetical protein [Herpetosiphon llansteffanensis]|uniref:DUF7948 domain-containing protein n=1 Tax=Herpetosiphon llansteffanensis TaxID=2094568 RepID=UPI000D7C2432|nr:hypothetical protein [Herpetosiphon llansteffanensis]